MATEGSFETTHRISGNYNTYAKFSWSLQSQSVEKNTSTISWNFTGKTANSYQYIALYGSSITVDGETKNGWTGNMYNGTTLFSGTKTITHGADGTKTFSASGWIKQYSSSAANNTGSGSWTLPAIARKAELSTVQSFDDTGNPTITYTNPAGSSVTTLQACISLTGATADVPYRDINKTGTLAYTFNLTDSERQTLLRAATSNTLNVTFFVKTVIGSTTLYSTKEATMTVVNGNPTFTDFSFADTNSAITAITGNNQILVQGKSALNVTISSTQAAVANKEATMVNYVASLSGKSVQADYAAGGNTLAFTDNNFTAGTQALAVKAIDSRGNATAVNKNVQVLEYADPAITVNATRANNFENTTTIKITGAISPLKIGSANKNALNNVSYRYKNQTASTWGSWTKITGATMGADGALTVPDTIINLDNTEAWNIEIRAQDKLATTIISVTVSAGVPIFRIGVDGNCYNNEKRMLNVDDLSDAGHRELTQAEYNALPESEKLNGTVYFITDGESDLKDYDWHIIAKKVAAGGESNLVIDLPSKYTTGCWDIRAEATFESQGNAAGTDAYVKLNATVSGASWAITHARLDNGSTTVSVYNSSAGYSGAEHKYAVNAATAYLTATWTKPSATRPVAFTAVAGGQYTATQGGMTYTGGKATGSTNPITQVGLYPSLGKLNNNTRIVLYARKGD